MSNETSYSPLMPKEGTSESNKTTTVVIVLIVLILIGGLFLISAKKSSDEEENANLNTPIPTNEEPLSTSTNLDSINIDIQNLEGTLNEDNLEQLDQEISNLE